MDSLHEQQVHRERFLVRDFLPRLSDNVTTTSAFPESEYETFPALITQANEWLQTHPGYSVQSCETVEFKLQDGTPCVEESTFRARGERPNCYMRGLRVWLRLIPDMTQWQQIGYFDVLPRWKSSDLSLEYLDDLQSEPLGHAVTRLNMLLRESPLEGKICSVHTFSVKFTDAGPLADRAVWKDRGYAKQYFLVGIRVFFVEATHGQLAFTNQLQFVDLVPQTLQHKNPYVRHPSVEAFSMVFRKARSAISHLPQAASLLNIQTLHFRQGYLMPVDTNCTNFCEDNMHSYQLKFLRLWFTSDTSILSPSPPLPRVRQRSPFALRCQFFSPVLLRKPNLFSKGRFETQLDLQARIREWIEQADIHVINVETIIMRAFSGAEHFEGFATMHTWNRVIHHSNAAHSHRHNFLHGRTHHRHGVRHCESSVAAETFVIVYRVYYFGEPEPDIELNRTKPLIENSLEEYMLARTAAACCIVI